MNAFVSPLAWRPPNWHSDLGDPTFELEHLRDFSLLLLSTVPMVTVALETPEPGLMDVQVKLQDGTVAEVHSIPCANIPDKRRLAIFFSPGTAAEKEIYAESVESAVSHFKEK